MRHYDRAGYRHLDHGDRYRDPEYVGDDGWVGPNEHPSTVAGTRTDRAQAEGGAPLSARPMPRPAPAYTAPPHAPSPYAAPPYAAPYVPAYARRAEVPSDAQVQPPPTAPARGRGGPRRDGVPSRPMAPAQRTGLFESILHPRQALQRAVRGIFAGRGPKNWTRSDHRIHDEVCERLAHHREVDATDIEVKVEKGEVTLTGTVASRHMKYSAEDTAADVLGVHDVHNRLRLASR